MMTQRACNGLYCLTASAAVDDDDDVDELMANNSHQLMFDHQIDMHVYIHTYILA